MEKEDIIIKISNQSGLLWPFYREKKALSASSLTKILKEIEYEDKKIPEFVLMKAAENGKLFHQAIQNFIEKGDDESYLSLSTSKKTLFKVKETIDFLKKNKFNGFIGSERLHYCFHKEDFFASYIDLEFTDFIIELKTNNAIIDKSPISMLAFKIQMLVQQICTKKDVYLLWSTGNGVFFNKFVLEKELFRILEILVKIIKDEENFSDEKKKRKIYDLMDYYLKSNSTKSFLANLNEKL